MHSTAWLFTLEEPTLGFKSELLSQSHWPSNIWNSLPSPALLIRSAFLEVIKRMCGPDPLRTAALGHPPSLQGEKSLHFILALQTADGSVFAVETVLQVDLGLPDEVV